MPGHEVQAPHAAAHDGLPDLDGLVQGPGHERDLLQGIAAIGHLGGNRVVLALVREGLLAKRLQDDLDLLLEELAIRLGVQQRIAEALHLAGVVAAADSEDDPPPGQDVGGGVVFGEPEGMPGGHDIEGAPDLDTLRAMGEIHGEQGNVGNALVPFVLEVVLGQPQGLVAQRVGRVGQRDGGVERLHEPLVGIAPIVSGRAREAASFQLDVADVERREARDHRGKDTRSRHDLARRGIPR